MIVDRQPQEIVDWLVMFHEDSDHWLGRFVPGRFKHVSLAAYASGARTWIYKDVSFFSEKVFVLLDGMDAVERLGSLSGCCSVLKFRSRERGKLIWRGPLTCVSSTKHTLGLECVGALPDQLYRALIREGATVVYDGDGKRRRRKFADGHDDVPSAAATICSAAGASSVATADSD